MNKIILMIVAGWFLFPGCSDKKTEDPHSHGPEPEVYTLYAENTELFVEFSPLITGKVSKFATHVTQTGDLFTALTEGTVTVSLIDGNNGIRNTADAPSTPGIFRLSLTPKSAGENFKLMFEIKTNSYTDKYIIDNVKVYPDEETAMSIVPAPADANEISYLKEQAWKVEFANAPVIKQPFHDIIKTSGMIQSAPGDEIIISAGTSGIVNFSDLSTMIGTEVRTGTKLFHISGGNISEDNPDAKFKIAKAEFEKAKTNFERASVLVKDKIISEKDYQNEKLAFENAQTNYLAIARNYSGSGQSVISTISGFIKNILVTDGQFVDKGTPMAIVSKNKNLILQANLSQKYFSKLPTIVEANFKPANSTIVYNTKELNGKTISYGKSASSNSPFIPLTFEISNPGNMVSGSVAEVYLKSDVIPNALVVPVSSLIEEQGIFYVYVQSGGESFIKREVVLGASDGNNVQVLSGVTESERVVTKGAYQIKLSTASGTLPAHGHEH